MAEIVDSLFGPTPLQINQAQNAALGQSADRYAAQDPFARATGQLYRAGGMLAGPVAEQFGMVNPAIEEARRRQAVMQSGGDLSTSAGLKAKAAEFAQAGDQQTAMKLLMVARKQEMEEAKAKMDSVEMRRKEAQTQRELAIAERALRPEGEGKPPASVQEYLYARQQGYQGSFEDWKKTQKAEGVSVTNVMPGTQKPIDVSKTRNEIRQGIKGELDQIGFADTAYSELELAMKTGNPIAYQTARTNIARAAGGGNISREEIRAAGGDPSLFGQITDKTSVWFTGTPSIDTQKKMLATVNAIRKVAAKKARDELDSQAILLHRAGYEAEDIDAILKMKEVEGEKLPPQGAVGSSDAALIAKHLRKKP